MIGFHSVMLRPDSVRRVRPPIERIPKTRAEHPRSQFGSDFGMVVGRVAEVTVAAGGDESVVARRREEVKKGRMR